MNKQEVFVKLQKHVGWITKQEAEQTLTAVLDIFKTELNKGGEIKIAGFGTMRVVKCKARNGRNPQTGQSIRIPSRRKVKFSTGTSGWFKR